jgi:hypothetical protein
MTAPKKRTRLQRVEDRRTAFARRHAELVAGFIADLGPDLPTIDRALIDHAATVALAAEQMKAAQLNDQEIDLEQLVRLTNSLTRIRIELGKRAATEKPMTHEERLQLDAAKPRREFDENDF